MGMQDQSFGAPQVAQGAIDRMGQNGLAFDPEVARILADPFGVPQGMQGQPAPGQMNFGSMATGGLRAGSNAFQAYNKIAPLFGGGSEAAVAGLGGAGSALSGGMAAGGTGLGVASPTAGVAGVLPGYTGTATGIFGSGASGGAAGGASGAGASGAGSLAGMAGVALPAAVLLGGLSQMFKPGTGPQDIAQGWEANSSHLTPENFSNYRADNPHLNGLLDLSMQDGQFDLGKYNAALAASRVGGKAFDGQALQQGQDFGKMIAANPALLQGPAATQDDWQSRLAATYGGG